jgi:hypothetical protein
MAIQGTVPVGGSFAPTDVADSFGTHNDKWGVGGYRIVKTLTDRINIPVNESGLLNLDDSLASGRRKLGMMVYVSDENKFYVLTIDVAIWEAYTESQQVTALADDTNFVEFSGGGGNLGLIKTTIWGYPTNDAVKISNVIDGESIALQSSASSSLRWHIRDAGPSVGGYSISVTSIDSITDMGGGIFHVTFNIDTQEAILPIGYTYNVNTSSDESFDGNYTSVAATLTTLTLIYPVDYGLLTPFSASIAPPSIYNQVESKSDGVWIKNTNWTETVNNGYTATYSHYWQFGTDGVSYFPGRISFGNIDYQSIGIGNVSAHAGSYGISLYCSVGYELNWQVGYLSARNPYSPYDLRTIYLDSLMDYSSDLSTTYTDRSLVDKEYVDSSIGTWGALDYPTWGTGTPFVKMTAVGVFALDYTTYLTGSDLPSTLDLFATTSADPLISGYTALVRNIADPRFDTIAQDVTTPVIDGLEIACGSLITDPNILSGNPGIFNFTLSGNIRKLSGPTASRAEFYFRIYKRTSAGVETLISESAKVLIPNNGLTYALFSTIALWNDGVFLNTDRIVLKFYGDLTGSGSGGTYQFQFGGISPVRGTAAIPVAVISNIYLRDLTDVENIDALDNEILYWNNTASLWEHSLVNDLMTTVSVAKGGTNLTSYAVGDLLYADGTTSLAKLAAVATGSVLISNGVTTAPSWSNSPELSNLTLSNSLSLTLGTSTLANGQLIFKNSTNAFYVTLQSGVTVSPGYTLTLPVAAPSGAQYLQSISSGGALQWTSGTTTGVSSIGTYANGTGRTNGALISGSVLTFGSATASTPGMVDTGTQIFAGAKTFQAQVNIGNVTYATSVLAFGGTTSNWISFPVYGNNIPTVNSTTSAGTRILIHPIFAGTSTNYAIGHSLTQNEMWLSAATPGASRVSFYIGGTRFAWFGDLSAGSSVPGLFLGATTTVGYLQMNSTTSNSIVFSDGGVAIPSITATRSVGSKIVIKIATFSNSTDYAIGYNTNVFWFSVPETTGSFTWYGNATSTMTLTTAGVLNLSRSTGRLQINSTQVVGPRDTGWTAMTGTTNEATAYASGSITLIQLAERVAALQAALTTHGLIGT